MILPQKTNLLSIYNTLESLDTLISRNDIILKSLILTKSDYTLSGARFSYRTIPEIRDVKCAEATINLIKIQIPVDLNVLCVYDNTFFWKQALNLTEGDYVFGITNSVVHSFPVQNVKFVTLADSQVELINTESDSTIVFIGSYLANLSQRYVAVAIR